MPRIQPDKHTHPDKCIISASVVLLDALIKSKHVGFKELLALVKERTGSDYILFMPAINLLFLFGLIEYHSKTDSFEYIGGRQ